MTKPDRRDRPEDGAKKTDQADCAWIACCGVWYSESAWAPPQVDVERDPEEAARTHRIVKEGTTNCPECRRSFRRHEVDVVSVERVLAIADASGESTREAAYAQRLQDTIEGEWLRFGPQTIEAGKSEYVRISSYVDEPVEVAFLSLPVEVAESVRVMDVKLGRTSHLDGPISGECFAVRVPTDARRPIDRGGSLSRRGTYYPMVGGSVVLENRTSKSIEVIGALFAPRAPKLSVVRAEVTAALLGGGEGGTRG